MLNGKVILSDGMIRLTLTNKGYEITKEYFDLFTGETIIEKVTNTMVNELYFAKNRGYKVVSKTLFI